MRQGTTPTHNFKIPFDVSDIAKVRITYAQQDSVILKKETEDCVFSENTISVTLTQEETLKFNTFCNVQIQIRVVTKSGDALASNVMVVDVNICLDGEVL